MRNDTKGFYTNLDAAEQALLDSVEQETGWKTVILFPVLFPGSLNNPRILRGFSVFLFPSLCKKTASWENQRHGNQATQARNETETLPDNPAGDCSPVGSRG